MLPWRNMLRAGIRLVQSGWRREQKSPEASIYNHRHEKLSPEKIAELNLLCERLLKSKELIASGKLQLIGLAKIQKRLGKRWHGLSKVVYQTVEDVLSSHLESSTDFFVRYKDDNYLIFFTHLSLEESTKKSAVIARDIQQRLFELDDENLRQLEIHQHVKMLEKTNGTPFQFDDFLESFPSAEDNGAVDMVNAGQNGDYDDPAPPDVLCIEVEAEDCTAKQKSKLESIALPKVRYRYMPVWDVKRNSINTYMCLASLEGSKSDVLDGHVELYGKLSLEQQAAMDMAMLQQVMAELQDIQQEGKKILLICPVQHSTLYNYGLFDQYRALLQKITPEQRPFLVFYIMDIQQTLPVKDAYWFVLSMKSYCRHVFAEVPLRQDINFTYLLRRQIDASGFRLSDIVYKKLSTDKMMNLFHLRATAMKMPMTFVFGLSKMDNMAGTALTKYHYVSGDMIHKTVDKPEAALKFNSEDMLVQLMANLSKPGA
jgi:hypothetical protein